MHMQMQVQQRINSFTSSARHWVGSARVLRKIEIPDLGVREVQDLMPAVGILAGAVACGLWWNSIAAGVFGGVTLLFLAGIYQRMKMILAGLSKLEHPWPIAEEKPYVPAPERKISETTAKAMERLQPWVFGETELSEDEAKTCCATLLGDGRGVFKQPTASVP